MKADHVSIWTSESGTHGQHFGIHYNFNGRPGWSVRWTIQRGDVNNETLGWVQEKMGVLLAVEGGFFENREELNIDPDPNPQLKRVSLWISVELEDPENDIIEIYNKSHGIMEYRKDKGDIPMPVKPNPPNPPKGDPNMDKYIKLLEKSGNIILTGAPGTGKTFLAKRIAMKMIFPKKSEADLSEEKLSTDEKRVYEAHCDFVQFHPSYDYTDFVEGLRAEELNGQVTFKLRNGIFKNFCERARENLNTKKGLNNFDELYEKFIDDMSENSTSFQTPVHKKTFHVEISSNKNCIAIPLTDVGTRMTLTKEMIKGYVVDGIVKDWKPYLTPVGNYFKEKYPLNITEVAQDVSRNYIFVIDEINRGEISKIFGELFFSIDPGYRDEKGRVKTQYQSLITDITNPFFNGFYIPKNVYIIGTMNDIDRSVDSFDFAMRRRFIWKEVTAEESAVNMKLTDKTISYMTRLNELIKNTQGLGSSYQIGGSYFLEKDKDGKVIDPDFESLWELRLEPLLKDYVRGLPKEKTLPVDFKSAYNGSTVNEGN
jgi:hypothetical protein